MEGMTETFRLKAYRWFSSRVSRVLRPEPPAPTCLRGTRKKRIWIHASSAGELEALFPVAEELLRKDLELVITVFSRSGLRVLERLPDTLPVGFKESLLFTGLSPGEGAWASWLDSLTPDIFMTVKYEAWPELWGSLVARDIPLVVIGASARPSIKLARLASLALCGKCPRVLFCINDERERHWLASSFKGSRVESTGDPRWDRVFRRLQVSSSRVSELVLRFSALARPWGTIGSAWVSDIETLSRSLSEVPGTLWVFPHRLDGDEKRNIARCLETLGRSVSISSEIKKMIPGESLRPAVIVDEMGFLTEFYAQTDWAYVGGGFGRGVHSTIEAAVHGIPVACGPRGALRFSEIALLQSEGQLRVVHSEDEMGYFLGEILALDTAEQTRLRNARGERCRGHTGASVRIAALLDAMLRPP